MPTKKQIITIGVLCVVALGLGYWYGMPEEKSPETKKPEPPEIELKPPTFTSDPSDPQNVIVEAAIRKSLEKPTGELTKADLEKVRRLDLEGNQLTDVKGLEKLTQLTYLDLDDNPDLTKAQIAELKKALPNCFILSNPTK